jgi:hypothetical protein
MRGVSSGCSTRNLLPRKIEPREPPTSVNQSRSDQIQPESAELPNFSAIFLPFRRARPLANRAVPPRPNEGKSDQIKANQGESDPQGPNRSRLCGIIRPSAALPPFVICHLSSVICHLSFPIPICADLCNLWSNPPPSPSRHPAVTEAPQKSCRKVRRPLDGGASPVTVLVPLDQGGASHDERTQIPLLSGQGTSGIRGGSIELPTQ